MKLEINKTSNQINIKASPKALIYLISDAKAFCEKMIETMPELINTQKNEKYKDLLIQEHMKYKVRFKLYVRMSKQLSVLQ